MVAGRTISHEASSSGTVSTSAVFPRGFSRIGHNSAPDQSNRNRQFPAKLRYFTATGASNSLSVIGIAVQTPTQTHRFAPAAEYYWLRDFS